MPLTILLADDSMTAQNMGKKILSEAGYDVVAVSNGAAAVKKIAERKPDLAVLDVYMPGYTGLEVCERVKTALETSAMPVLLTVGRMEPFKPEEGTRVRADGIIVKPFEAQDLLSAIQKLEQRLNLKGKVVATATDPAELPEYERTVKIAAPVFDEHDESYQAWKSAESDEPAQVKVPTGMQTAPAFADELGVGSSEQHVTSRYTAPTEPIEPQVILKPAEAAATGTASAGEAGSGVGKLLSKAKGWFGGSGAEEPATPAFAEEELQPVQPTEPASDYAQTIRVSPPVPETVREFERVQSYGATEAPAPTAAAAPEAAAPALSSAAEQFFAATVGDAPAEPLSAAAFEPTASEPVEVAPSAAPGFEPTSAPATEQEHDTASASGFEPTSARDETEVAAGGMDSALITDVSEMSTAFPTKFGVEGAEPVHVGDASEFPELYTSPTAEGPATAELAAPEPQAISESDFDQKVAAAMETSWAAEEAPLEEHERGATLHQEMQQQLAQAAPAPGPEPESAHVHVEAAAAPKENEPDHELAAAMAAAVGSQIEPVVAQSIEQTAAVGDSTQSMDQHTAVIAEIVQRVTERIKPELIEQISRELAELKKKKS